MTVENPSLSSKLKALAVIVLHLIIGLVLMMVSQKVKLPFGVHPAFVTAALFAVLLFVDIRLLKLQAAFRVYWSPSKIYLLLVGILSGTLIGLAPELIAMALKKGELLETTFHQKTVWGLVVTLVIVGWEELWFRGVFINYCRKHLSPLAISMVIGLLFMAVHALNPVLDLWVSGPALFLAGTMLTLAYFVSKSFWLPLGLHFGNNTFGSSLNLEYTDPSLFSDDGYLSTFILLLAVALFIFLDRRMNSANEKLI